MSDIFNKLWGFCHTLRHDGIDYGGYIEQITFLLFLKMAAEKRIDVKANVIFFQKGASTENVWIFDARSNVPGITKKNRRLSKEHFAEFDRCWFVSL